MSYTLAMIVISIGIIEFFQLVSILIFLYTHICLCMYAFYSNGINLYWYLIFHTYMFYLCLLYPYILSTNFVYAKLELLMNIIFQLISFQLVSLNKLMHVFSLYFIKGEKIRFSYFNWYLYFHSLIL